MTECAARPGRGVCHCASVPDRGRETEGERTTKRSMQRLLVALLLVSVLPGASGGDAGPPLGGRKMGFAGETAGVLARYFNKVALLEIDRHIVH